MLCKLVALAFIVGTSAVGQPPGLILQGLNGSVILSASDLESLPQHHITTTDHGSSVAFDGVLLFDLLAKIEAPSGSKLRGRSLSLYLLVEARDGYRAVYSLPEFDPGFTDRNFYLVSQRDGKPLTEEEGPFRIVVPDEKAAARWVKQVKTLSLRQAQ